MGNTMKPRQRALVTGATGYIGANLVRRLSAESWDVHVLVRPTSSLVLLESLLSSITVHEFDGDSSTMDQIVKRSNPDVVFHLASLFLSEHRPEHVESLVHSNVLFSTQLVEAMVNNDCKCLINTGTSWQHFEDADYCPVNLYAATKQAFEVILDYYVEARGLALISLALFDTYGPGDPRPKLFSLLSKTAKSQEPLAMSAGEQLLDLVHIDDVIEAFMCAARAILDQESGRKRFGVSTGQPIRLKDLVQLYEQAAGVHLPIQWGQRPYREREVMLPWSNCERVSGWEPKVALLEGLRSLVNGTGV